jgi:glycosyltransferase involved in cell wall biosynthesis
MNKPLVSIIIPVYNGSNFLSEAIDSALSQTYPNCEVIVVNDGSTDATEDICIIYGDKIRYYKQDNQGVSVALNYGISLMKGEYFSWLSHDDVYYPNKIQIQIETLFHLGEADSLVFGDYDILIQETGTLHRCDFSKCYPQSLLENSIFPVMYHLLGGCDILIHKSLFERFGGFDANLYCTQDYDMWLRLFRSQKTAYVNNPLYISRSHSMQGQKTKNSQLRNEERTFWVSAFAKLTNEERKEFFGTSDYFKVCAYSKLRSLGAFESVESDYDQLKDEEMSNIRDCVTSTLYPSQKSISLKLCIFGTGNYGMQLYYLLNALKISVDCFADNNHTKARQVIVDGVVCLSFEELCEIKDSVLVVVAIKCFEDAYYQLSTNGFNNIITKQSIDDSLSQHFFERLKFYENCSIRSGNKCCPDD